MSQINNQEEDKRTTNSVAVEDGFDFMGLFLEYLSCWPWFVIGIALALGYAYYHLSTIIPTYAVEASVYLADESSQASVSILGSQVQEGFEPILDQTEIEILKSRNSLIRIVDSLDLSYAYTRKGRFRDYPLYKNNSINVKLDSTALYNLGTPIKISITPDGNGNYTVRAGSNYAGEDQMQVLENVTLPAEIDLVEGKVLLEQNEAAGAMTVEEKVVISNPNWVARSLSSRLSIAYAENAGSILKINISTPIIAQGEDIIRALLVFYNRQILEEKNRSAIQTERFILDRLALIEGERKVVTDELLDFKLRNDVAVSPEQQAAMSYNQKDKYIVEVAQLQSQLSMLNMVQSQISGSDNYTTIPVLVDNASVMGLLQQYNTRVSQYERLSLGRNMDAPDQAITDVRDQLNRLKSQIISAISSAKSALQSQINTQQALASRSDVNLDRMPRVDKDLQEIMAEKTVKDNIYTYLLQKREEIALQKTLATPTAHLIDDPMGYGPIAPKRSETFMIALLVGILIPAALILLRRLVFPIFKDQQELERATKLPIISEISKTEIKKGEDPNIVVGENVNTPVAELFRLLRNNISFTRNAVNSKVILVSSSISGEGKSFISVNLALTYALSGKKVALVGLDIRRPRLSQIFGISGRRGVTTYLSGQENDLTSLIHTSEENANLDVLPAGPIPPNPNELLISDRMTQLMTYLRAHYDVVILDSAPIGVISDSFLVINHSDLQLFVLRAGYSTKRCLRVLHQAVAQNKLQNVYILLNGVDIKSNAYLYKRYGRYGYYSKHGNAYGYGYGNEPQKKRYRLFRMFRKKK